MRTKPEKSQFTAVFQKAIAEAKKRKPRVTKSDVARACGVKPPSVKKWADGISEPTLANLVKVAELLGCSTDYLLGRVGQPGVVVEGDANGSVVSSAPISGATISVGSDAQALRTRIAELEDANAQQRQTIADLAAALAGKKNRNGGES